LKPINVDDKNVWFERGVRCLERHEYGQAVDRFKRARVPLPWEVLRRRSGKMKY
jgi:hypothetical protein